MPQHTTQFQTFRFQTGSIKRDSREAVARFDELAKFRFQTGSIKSISDDLVAIARRLFRFQTGSIKSIWNLETFLYGNTVSIPKWFD